MASSSAVAAPLPRSPQHPDVIYAFLNAYSQLPNANWHNEIVRVEYADSAPWVMLACMPQIRAALLFLVAENDEMENCSKAAQHDVFKRAQGANEPKRIVEMPCTVAPGFGHAGAMDSCGLVGHKSTWLGMVTECESFIRDVFG